MILETYQESRIWRTLHIAVNINASNVCLTLTTQPETNPQPETKAPDPSIGPVQRTKMASLNSLQKRFDRSIKNDDFYGAEQACRMMHHRLTQSKSPTPEDIDRAREILRSASVTLLKKHQTQAGAALGLLLIKHSEDHKNPVSHGNVTAILEIANAFSLPPDADKSTSQELKREKLRFVKAAIAWSAREDCQGFRNGHAGLNSLGGIAAADAGDFELAQRLFVYSDSPEEFANFLHDYTEKHTLKSEKALALTRAVLKYLASENIKDAVVLRTTFSRLKGWQSVEDPESSSSGQTEAPPLANFCELVIKLCQLQPSAAPLYTKIASVYQPELRRDESIPPMITSIGTQYFGIQPPAPTGLGGMMNSMLRGLMSS